MSFKHQYHEHPYLKKKPEIKVKSNFRTIYGDHANQVRHDIIRQKNIKKFIKTLKGSGYDFDKKLRQPVSFNETDYKIHKKKMSELLFKHLPAQKSCKKNGCCCEDNKSRNFYIVKPSNYKHKDVRSSAIQTTKSSKSRYRIVPERHKQVYPTKLVDRRPAKPPKTPNFTYSQYAWPTARDRNTGYPHYNLYKRF